MTNEEIIARMPIGDLLNGLSESVKNGLVNVSMKGDLALYTYSREAMYEKKWDTFTRAARGLIIDLKEKEIVALPFSKFFNYGEESYHIPDEPFTVLEKVDGSLGIVYYHDGKWRVATKGSFDSDQAVWAQKYLDNSRIPEYLYIGFTYLFEIVYPENRIVISYGTQKELYFLDAISCSTGKAWSTSGIPEITPPCLFPLEFNFNSIPEVLETKDKLSSNEEGYVITFKSGYRIKIKGDEYCRIAKIIERVTPLGIWKIMANGDDTEILRREIPEEFLDYFDDIVTYFKGAVVMILDRVDYYASKYETCKDVGQALNAGLIDNMYANIMFLLLRKVITPEELTSSERVRELIYKRIRPKNNILRPFEEIIDG